MTSSPARVPGLVTNSVPMSSERGLGLHGNSLPSGSSLTTSRPSGVMTEPSVSMITRAGMPRTLNLVLREDFLSLWVAGSAGGGGAWTEPRKRYPVSFVFAVGRCVRDKTISCLGYLSPY